MTTCGTSSGGYFNNKWYIISEFASDLQLEINTDKHGTNIEGCALPARRFQPETLKKIQLLQHVIELSGLLAMEIEILYSKGQGDTNFVMLTDGLLKKYTKLIESTEHRENE